MKEHQTSDDRKDSSYSSVVAPKHGSTMRHVKTYWSKEKGMRIPSKCIATMVLFLGLGFKRLLSDEVINNNFRSLIQHFSRQHFFHPQLIKEKTAPAVR